MDEFSKNEILGLIVTFPGVVFMLGKYFFSEYKKTKTDLQKKEHALHKKEIEMDNLKQNQRITLESQMVNSALNEMKKDIDGIGASVRNAISQFRKLEDMNVQSQIKQQAAIGMVDDLVSQMRSLNNSMDSKIRQIAREEFKSQKLHLVDQT